MSISITDQDLNGHLQNFCYDNCNKDDNDNLKISRGLIYKNNQPFIKSFGFTPEYTINTIDTETIQYIKNNISNLRFYFSLEGTLLRMYWNDVNNKWYISTHKKLDARNSRWGSKYTFGEIIDSIIPDNFYESLNKDYCYMFILTPNEQNRIVCNNYLNQLFHVGTFDKSFNLSYDIDTLIQKPVEISIKSYDHLCNFVNHSDFPYNVNQGIVICDNVKQSNIKILNNTYNELRKIRGNTASLMFRYLEVRNDSNVVNSLRHLFPKYVTEFDKYENMINLISKKLFDEYMFRHVKKQYRELIPNEHYILKQAHNWHKQDRENNKMSKEKIYEIINNQTPVVINSLIKLYK